ncbi:Putative uncharacterized protein [Halomonas sp. R57-5]|nr:Putative uncharacterized protein [Halomonas sp. R57-5]
MTGLPAHDPRLGKAILFHTNKTGAGKEIRTPDPRLGKAMLYH